MDGHGRSLFRCKPASLCRCTGICLNKKCRAQGVATSFCHSVYELYAILLFVNMVTQLVVSLVLTIYQNIYGPPVGRVGHSQAAAQLKGQKVAHERLVAIVVDECPLLGFCRGVKHLVLLIVLNAVWFLGEANGGIATQPDCSRVCPQFLVVVADNRYQCIDIMYFVVRLHIIFCMDTHRREVGQTVQIGIVAFARMAIERYFGDVAPFVRWSYIPHVAESFRASDVGVVHDSVGT